MENSQSIVFVQFFSLIALSCAIAWTLLATLLRIAPRASWCFAAANTFTVIGILLYTQRTEAINYLYWFVADMTILLGFALVRWGCQYLFKQALSYRFDLILLTTAALLMLLVPPSVIYAVYLVIVMSMTAAIFISLSGIDNFRAVKKHLPLYYAALLNVPFFTIGLLFIIRAIVLLFSPQQLAHISAADKLNSPLVLWSYIILLLLTNLVLFGNALARLVFKVARLANKDQLTGLWNRHALLDKLKQVDALWLRNDLAYSLMVLDLDHFKRINDTYGHLAGDKVLKHTAETLQNTLRKIDFICRYGGEEFLIILPLTNKKEAQIVAEKIQQKIKESVIVWQKKQISTTLSIGYATCKTHLSIEQLLQLADDAMYLAKSRGRNTICSLDSIEQANEIISTTRQ
ncbi:GGDEF domain-containing protein [Shewanella vesiculosa]|uniref:GGDEF domain-containing protein n=1 Tax=Shewanella vesiculosa TaxID=518738 RepID=UPI001404FDEF|nr:GGDEF domain-containing protein [Shewanella vesiculosa]UJL41896.1 GGDEF domain-containing protein [Shewanella vesiculosa]